MNLRKVLLLLLVLGGVAAFFACDLGRDLSLEYLKQSQASFAELYAREPLKGVRATGPLPGPNVN